MDKTELGERMYALSVFGWGVAGKTQMCSFILLVTTSGAVALKADKLRWIPGQKKVRYDIAGAISMLTVIVILFWKISLDKDWPIIDEFIFEYPETDDPHVQWFVKWVHNHLSIGPLED